MILLTQRLRLDPLTRADAALVYPLMNDPEVMAHLDASEVDDPDVVAGLIAQQVADTETGTARYWAMRTLDGEGFVGVCDLSQIERTHHTADVGFMLRRDAWGKGYALEAMRVVVAHAAGDGFKVLTARTHLGNRRSEALLLNLGFKDDGRVRGMLDRDGERRDCRLWRLTL